MIRYYLKNIVLVIIFLSFSFSDYGIYKEIDDLHDKSKFQEALAMCKNYYNNNTNDVEILWRLARSYFDIADQTSDVKLQKENIDKALPYAKKALELDPLSAKSNHWYAVIIGKKGVLEGTKQKIINSREVEKHAKIAIKLDPSYDGTHHLMGRWHYNIANLAWYEKTIANTIYATVPEGSFSEAIDYFIDAMNANPEDIRHYLWLAKSYYAKSNYEDARHILEKAKKLQIKNDSDRLLMEQVEDLYDKL